QSSLLQEEKIYSTQLAQWEKQWHEDDVRSSKTTANISHTLSVSAESRLVGTNWLDVTIGRENNYDVKLSHEKRTQGIALIGKNGTGKSSLIHAILSQELQGTDATLLLFDPHGELARDVLRTGKNARKQVIWITPETTTPFRLNLLEANPKDYEAVERTTDTTKQIF